MRWLIFLPPQDLISKKNHVFFAMKLTMIVDPIYGQCSKVYLLYNLEKYMTITVDGINNDKTKTIIIIV